MILRRSPSRKYPKETLLREPHEYVAAWSYLLAAGFLLIASEAALLIPSLAYSGSALFLWRAVYRWSEGRYIRRYQRNLTDLPPYEMRSSELKVSYKHLFVGVGFEWTAVHAQRLYDIELPKNEKYVRFSRGYRWAREFSHRHELSRGLSGRLAKWLDSDSRFNPWKPVLDLEGNTWLHTVGMPEGEKKIYQPLSTRVSHTLVEGTTRVGKTRLAEILVSQDIARGDVVIVFDPKGDEELLLRMYTEAKKAGREDEFYMFHLGFPEQSALYNPVGSFVRVTEVATRIARQMPAEGNSLAFREFVWGFVNQISKGLVLLGRTPSYPVLKVYSQDVEPLFIDVMEMLFERHGNNHRKRLAELEKAVEMNAEDRRKNGYSFTIPRSMQERNKIGKAYWLLFREQNEALALSDTERDVAWSMMNAIQTDASYMAKLVASLAPFLEKMTTGAVSKLIAPDYEDPSRDVFSWAQIIQSRGIVYVGLDALSDAEVAATVGNSMFADLTSVAGRIYKHGVDHGLPPYPDTGYKPKINLHADEFNELCGPEFIPMLNKAGGAGIQVTAYTQTLADIEAKINSRAKAEQMIGNFNTVIMLRVRNESTAKLIIEKQSKVNVSALYTFSGAVSNSDVSSDTHFTSSTQSREQLQSVDLLRVGDLTHLPKGQAFAELNGGRLYKIRIPWLKHDKNATVPEDIRFVGREMRERYKSLGNDWAQYQEYFDAKESINEDAPPGTDLYNDFILGLDDLEERHELAMDMMWGHQYDD